ncbi:hypothetical protein [Algicola sagamiensis]|uniref:hypothetical protein n=1 Tax=Algicola sagamiensis TaxID=163869 RepID=UPI00036F3BBA|nr:hypothetical protein [Algicola sagamiensis]
MNVFIAFTEDDCRHFILEMNEGDMLIGEGGFTVPEGNHYIDVNKVTCKLDIFTQSVREWFHEMIKDCGFPDTLIAFSNNLFECTVWPIIRYIEALKSALLQSPFVAQVTFQKKLFGHLSGPNYFLAEHESQGIRLYRRSDVIQPIIERYLKNHHAKISIRYLSKGYLLQPFYNLLRLSAVFFVKLMKEIKRASWQASTTNHQETYSSIESTVVARGLSALEFVSPLLQDTQKKVLLLVGQTFVGQSAVQQAKRLLKGQRNILIAEIKPKGKVAVFQMYVKALWKILTLRTQVWECQSIQVDLTQAVREVLVMSVDLSLYAQSLEIELNHYPMTGDVLFSMEQKSPHAWADSFVANKVGLKCAHLMQCDQRHNDLPYPVFGHFFFVDTLRRKHLFESSWSTCKEKLRFLGAIKASPLHYSSISQNEHFTACYFADCDDVALSCNLTVVALLEREAKENPRFSYAIKLHPRDKGVWLKSFKSLRGRVFHHGTVAKGDLLSMFSVAISNPSGIVFDLLCQQKPFILLDIIEQYQQSEQVYCDTEYIGYIRSYEQILPLLMDIERLETEVRLLRQRVLGHMEWPVTFDALVQCAS